MSPFCDLVHIQIVVLPFGKQLNYALNVHLVTKLVTLLTHMRYYIPYLNRSTVTESLPKLHLAEQQHIIEAHIRAVPSMRQFYARKVIIGNFQLKIREHMDNFSLYPPYLS